MTHQAAIIFRIKTPIYVESVCLLRYDNKSKQQYITLLK